jgi:glycosyltransferase involved in cell wall biosynthesis
LRYVLINVARLSEQKAQENIIRAACDLKKKGKKITVQIVGEGPLRPQLERLIAESNLREEVRLLGFRDDIGGLLRAADLFVLPSHDEGLPMSLLEAMSYKVPVIVTPVGEIPKIIRHGATGVVVPVNDAAALAEAIAWSMDNRELLAGMADKAYGLLVEKYSSRSMKQGYEKIYGQLITSVS